MQQIRKRKSNSSFDPLKSRFLLQGIHVGQKQDEKKFHLLQSKQATQAKDDLLSFNNFFSCELFNDPKLSASGTLSNDKISSWNGVTQINFGRESKTTKKLVKTQTQKEQIVKYDDGNKKSWTFLSQNLITQTRLDQRKRMVKTATDWLEKYEKINDQIKEIRSFKTRAKSLRSNQKQKLIQFQFGSDVEKQKNMKSQPKKEKDGEQLKKKMSHESKPRGRGKWITCKDNPAQISRIYDFWQ